MAQPVQKPERCCPQCAASFECVINREPKPEPGNFSACYMCGCVLVFAENLEPRYPNQEEFDLLTQAPDALRQLCAYQFAALRQRHLRN